MSFTPLYKICFIRPVPPKMLVDGRTGEQYPMRMPGERVWLTPAPGPTEPRGLSTSSADAELLPLEDALEIERELVANYPLVLFSIEPGNFHRGEKHYPDRSTLVKGRARMRREAHPPKPPVVDTDPYNLLQLGFTRQEAHSLYSWERRQRLLDVKEQNPEVSYTSLGDHLGISGSRVKQIVDKARRERRHPRFGLSKIGLFLNGRNAAGMQCPVHHVPEMPEFVQQELQMELKV